MIPYQPLVDGGTITHQQLSEAQAAGKVAGTDRVSVYIGLESYLIKEIGLTKEILGRALEHYYGVSYFNFKPDNHTRPSDAMENMSKRFLMESQWLPIGYLSEHSIAILVLDPQHMSSLNPHPSIVYGGKTEIKILVSSAIEFMQYREWLVGKSDQPMEIVGDDTNISDIVGDLETTSSEDDEEDEKKLSDAEDSVITKLVNKILLDAYISKASDIHIEPILRGKASDSVVRIRMRKDGALVKYTDVSFKYRSPLLSRIKVMAQLDISERRRPQDGKIKASIGGAKFELRVATIPTQGGMEDAVMRVLASGKPLPLNKMGFTRQNEVFLKACVSKPYGLFFVCGPTGSGKTTTLHSVLGFLNTEDTKIWTAEDPVEIVQEGLRQVQINKKAGIDFNAVMRSFLRADPDIIMVGEMRDHETVSTGVEASLTGHLVFSTLHTNSAPESITRLLDMGMDPFNFADALLGILAQRLGKTLCGKCKESYTPDRDEISMLVKEYSEELINMPAWKGNEAAKMQEIYKRWVEEYGTDGKLTLSRAKAGGCNSCNGTGFSGRVGLHELMVCDDNVKAAIQRRARPAEIAMFAMEAGMRTLKQDGIEKVIMGKTTIEQIRSVCIK